ncbi:MAG: type II toxin-antitoxin system VapC family toxin [Agitococcus sp.]|nr:type II toxin-antitoxin system VapC family toxin [Agitococcus sp.]
MKRILLDSCVWLWWLDDNPILGKNAKALISDERNMIFVSAATVWEVAIKRQKSGLHIEGDLQDLVAADGFIPLAIDLFHAQQAAALPPIHQDPFDRMLIAQAQAEGLELITADTIIPKYGIRTVLARV